MMHWNEPLPHVRTTPIAQANELKFSNRSSALLSPGHHRFGRDQSSVMQTPGREIHKSKTWQLRKLIESDSEKEDLVAGKRATLIAQLNASKQPKKLRSQSRGLRAVVALVRYFLKCLCRTGIALFPLLARMSYVTEILQHIIFATEKYLKKQIYRYVKRAVNSEEDVSFIYITFIFPFLYFAAVIGLILEVLGDIAAID